MTSFAVRMVRQRAAWATSAPTAGAGPVHCVVGSVRALATRSIKQPQPPSRARLRGRAQRRARLPTNANHGESWLLLTIARLLRLDVAAVVGERDASLLAREQLSNVSHHLTDVVD